MFDFYSPISKKIWEDKYQFKNFDGSVEDKTVEDTWRRVAGFLSSKEDPKGPWFSKFYNILEGFKFLPAGRIISGAGTNRDVTLFNCYVMGEIPDSMAGIFDMLKEAALTMQQGGGIGYDFSTIRPKGTEVKGVGADASGPLSFMDVWSAMCQTIMSAGSRRGAMMATMICDHPDIEDFITAKNDPARLRMFNMSVLVTDDFMQAVLDDENWELQFEGVHYKSIPARDLWDLIMKNTYAQAEPGVIFIDRINEMNNLSYCEKISATNPCGEQPLPPYGACLLGSVNLTQLVKDPFTDKASLSYDELDQTVSTAVRMLDNVIDLSKFPLPQQEKEAKDKRRIGIGVTGVADALIMLKCRYGSVEAQAELNAIMREIAISAYRTSIDLAQEKGSFPVLFNGPHSESPFIQNLDSVADNISNDIWSKGIRNSHLLSIAPTGTISLYAGNVSSGIEPVFAYEYTRKVLNPDGTKREEKVRDYAYEKYVEYLGREPETLPEYFVTAQDLTPADHLSMQAVAQIWVDSSISKTINCPEDISFDDFKDIYMEAWRLGCKGCTTYRPNDITGSILSVEKPKEPEVSSTRDPDVSFGSTGSIIRTRGSQLEGKTYKMNFGTNPHATYVTMNYSVDEAGQKRPFEIFINSKNMDHYVWMVGLTRMISAIFRVSDDVTFVVEELKGVFDPKGGAFMDGKYVPSILAAIGGLIENFLKEIHYLEEDGSLLSDESKSLSVGLTVSPVEKEPETKPMNSANTDLCPMCFSSNIKMDSGCPTCIDCGHSKCG